MEEHTDLMVQALPPILSSIGGFFVLLFFGYGKDQLQKRIMSAALLVLLVWTVNVCVVMAGEKLTLFSPYITIISLIISAGFFIVVFYYNVRSVETSDAFLVTLFSLGVLFSTVGFVNYFAMSDRIVISVSEELCEEDLSLKKNYGGEAYSVRESNFLGEVGFVIQSGDFNDITSVTLVCPNKSDKKKKLNAFNKSTRGLGVEHALYKD